DEGDSARGIRALARTLQSEQRATRMALGPLRPEEIGDLIARTPVFERAPEELSVAVARLSEGNPLFAWQLLRSYEETQRVPDADGAVQTVGDAIMTRVDRLDPAVRAVAEAAATVGRSFTVELVAAAGGWNEDVVRDGLDDLVHRHLAYTFTAGDETYVYSHALIAGAVYAASEPAARQTRHRRLARLLERMEALDSATLASQARHWDLAGSPREAYRAYMRAAQAALAVYARDDVAAYGRRAAALADDDAERYAALTITVRALLRSGDAASTLVDLEQLDPVATRLGGPERFAALEIWCQYLAHLGDAGRHAPMVAEMFAYAQTSGDAHHRIAALDAQSYLLVASGRVAEAEPLLTEAGLLAESIGDAELQARLIIRLGHVQIRLGKRAVALATLRRRRDALTDTSSPVEWLELFAAEINCAFVLEEMELGERAGTQQLALAQRVGDLESEGKARGVLSYAAHWRGNAASMREHSDRAIEVFERIGHSRSLGVTLLNRGTLEFELGRVEDALRFWER
ncbi:MAG TPA: hypothetical protein VN224_07920, partial [Xanthomonadales bacterium]|nr:hypothetical protein [Xanthomonadales bacterium]